MGDTAKKTLHGGDFHGERVSDFKEDNLWITVYSLNGKQWTPPSGVFYKNFPAGVISHGYRKQKDGQFHHAWTRPVGE